MVPQLPFWIKMDYSFGRNENATWLLIGNSLLCPEMGEEGNKLAQLCHSKAQMCLFKCLFYFFPPMNSGCATAIYVTLEDNSLKNVFKFFA